MEWTVKEYADKRKISTQAVTQAMGKKHRLPGVKSRRKISHIWLLTIDEQKLNKFLSQK